MGKLYTYCLGNPPYQSPRATTKDMPVYNDFMEAAKDVADKVEFITPGRFLFNGGATPKAWNKKMLNDPHFKVLAYEPDSSKVFPNTDIKGGIAIHYYDESQNFEPIRTFAIFPELNSIREKVSSDENFVSLNTIMYPYSTYTLSEKLFKDYPNLVPTGKKDDVLSNKKIITTNIFELLPNLFFKTKPDDEQEYVCLLGRTNGQRCYRWILAKYINVGPNFDKWKVILPKTNGSGTLGEVLVAPLIGTPLIGYTQTFLGIGACNTKAEAEALYKYVCGKFARVCLGILKTTQDNPPEKWKYVPLQDFTDSSDIDWSKSIPEIDQQLYERYELSDDEVKFIEEHVKAME